MFSSVQPTQQPSQSSLSALTEGQVASILGPGLASLFIQGIVTGLIFAQFSRWFSKHDCNGSPVLSIVVIFVTIVGLAQTGICFASAWQTYVQHFGILETSPNWEDVVQSIPTNVISFPVQALLIRRCHYLVGKNMYIIMSLVLFLVASIVMSIWSSFLLIHSLRTTPEEEWGLLPEIDGLVWPYTMALLLPSILDLSLTGILLRYLTRTKKQVYAPKKRKLITRLMNIVWQSALPPTLCAMCVFVFYILIATTPPRLLLEVWFPVIQGLIGKLYVLSLLHMINAQPLQSDGPTPDEISGTFISTFTVPEFIFTRSARVGDDACGELAAEHRPARSLDFIVYSG